MLDPGLGSEVASKLIEEVVKRLDTPVSQPVLENREDKQSSYVKNVLIPQQQSHYEPDDRDLDDRADDR